MSGIPFHSTGYGKRFFDGQLPDLIRQLGRIADSMEAPKLSVGTLTTSIQLTPRELSTVLAGLRLLQRQVADFGGQSLPLGILDILLDHPEVLDSESDFAIGIGRLCEKLNL